MKIPFSPSGMILKSLLAALILLVAGCAPPPPSDSLQRRIDELLQIQQEQARQLEQLQQQLAGLGAPPTAATENRVPAAATPLPGPEEVPPSGAALLPQAPSSAEIAALSASAALYLESFAAIATGNMVAARDGFADFVRRYPDHQYAANARFWEAEALLSLGETRRGESLLLDIIDAPTPSDKTPAAMARLVALYRQTGAADNARAMLEMLSSRYPDSPELKRLLRSDEPR